MTNKETGQPIIKTVTINAAPSIVWDALTKPELMRQWMSETHIDIITDWEVGSLIIIRGDWYKAGFENKGSVIEFVPERIVKYSHLSSLSRLADEVANYTVLEFKLVPEDHKTILTLTVSNFPTEAIYKHFAFYWGVALELLRKFVEQ